MQPHCRWISIPLLLTLLISTRGYGQTAAPNTTNLQKQLDTIQAHQKVLENDILLIKNMLLGRQVGASAPPLKDLMIDVKGAATLGSQDAKVVIVEFTDYQCPFCGRYANETFGKVIQDYVTPGKVQYVLKDFPLEGAHPLAPKLAQAAACAGEQGKFWEAHERLFRNQGAEMPDLLPRQEKTLGLDETKFQECFAGSASLTRVATDTTEAKRLGLDATPTFLFGFRDSKDPTKVRAVKMLTGAQPQLVFEQILEYLLDPPPTQSGGN